jgi:hypothetical protein
MAVHPRRLYKLHTRHRENLKSHKCESMLVDMCSTIFIEYFKSFL